jgi:hypothetical protein
MHKEHSGFRDYLWFGAEVITQWLGHLTRNPKIKSSNPTVDTQREKIMAKCFVPCDWVSVLATELYY